MEIRTKPNILIFIDWFLPSYRAGGPIQSVNNIILNLKTKYNFYIITSDSDLDAPLDLKAHQKNKWIKKDTHQVIYVDKKHQNKSFYNSIIQDRAFIAIYLNSMFSPRFSLLPFLLFKSKPIKIILAPRGMLGKGALSIKPFKKKVFLKVFKILRWHRRITWHATTMTEENEIIKRFGTRVDIETAPNLSSPTTNELIEKDKKPCHLNLFFMSRISTKKNLLGALKVLMTIDKKYQINFSIIGPVEDKHYWQSCMKLIKSLPNNIIINQIGPVPHYNINNILTKQHVLFLPTLHENFGHVIVEAWQNACPVIISNQTPWQNLTEKKIGYAHPLNNLSDYKISIERFAAMNQETFNDWTINSKKFAQQITDEGADLKKYKTLFEA